MAGGSADRLRRGWRRRGWRRRRQSRKSSATEAVLRKPRGRRPFSAAWLGTFQFYGAGVSSLRQGRHLCAFNRPASFCCYGSGVLAPRSGRNLVLLRGRFACTAARWAPFHCRGDGILAPPPRGLRPRAAAAAVSLHHHELNIIVTPQRQCHCTTTGPVSLRHHRVDVLVRCWGLRGRSGIPLLLRGRCPCSIADPAPAGCHGTGVLASQSCGHLALLRGWHPRTATPCLLAALCATTPCPWSDTYMAVLAHC